VAAGTSQVALAGVVARNDLRRRLRNRTFLVYAVAGPLLLATIITLAFGSGDEFDATIGVVDDDGSPMAAGFVDALTGDGVAEGGGGDLDGEGDGGADEGADGPGSLDFERVSSVDEARRLVDDDDLGAAIVVPSGFTASLATDEPGDVEVLAGADDSLAVEIARAVAAELTLRADAERLAATTAQARGGAPPGPGAVAGAGLPVRIETTGSGGDVSPAAYFGPGMGLLFLFLSVGIVARELLWEKRTGLLDRLRSGPMTAGAFLAGRGLAVVVMSVSSLTVIWAVTAGALGADWGQPVGVVLLILTSALAVAGIGALVAAVARTEQQADNLATTVAFVFAMLGGAFIPPGDLPDTLARLGVLTPTGWALRGFADLSAGGGTVVDVLPSIVALLLWALVPGVVAARLLPRRLGVA
jgi:ABC-2 type transport system permease protein